MSVGEICVCERPGHPSRRPSGLGNGCGRYAADQTNGGLCGSCASSMHKACDRLTTTNEAGIGTCVDCGWHSSDHRRDVS